ncbi:hypothetical protein BIW11_08910 [Tropilaelaps mercedesae]|uniref:Transmembrane protein n=1 Tax=Tropilaelaps mercedesae TaxID=418985 RepID=A0A1V9XMF9_9ACAR|nr:hypothetical protein BIW11_08910 [Tropilaelaps mercedesae]
MPRWLRPRCYIARLPLILAFLWINKNLFCVSATLLNKEKIPQDDGSTLFRLSADRETSETLLRVLKDSPQVASFKTDYSSEDSACTLCWWEVKVEEPKPDQFVAALRARGLLENLSDSKEPIIRDEAHDLVESLASDEPSESSDPGGSAYNMLASAWSKLFDDIQDGVGQLRSKNTAPWLCYWVTSMLLCSALWVAAAFLKYGTKKNFASLRGGAVYEEVLTDVEVNDDAVPRQPSWTTPPLHRGIGVHRSRHHLGRPSSTHGSKPSNLLSRTDVEYYDVEGMLDDIPYYEPRLSGRRP